MMLLKRLISMKDGKQDSKNPWKVTKRDGMENSSTMLGQGTLSKTLGILEKIWKKDKSIFNWPNILLTFLIRCAFSRVDVSVVFLVLQYRYRRTTRNSMKVIIAIGIKAVANDAPPGHAIHFPAILT